MHSFLLISTHLPIILPSIQCCYFLSTAILLDRSSVLGLNLFRDGWIRVWENLIYLWLRVVVIKLTLILKWDSHLSHFHHLECNKNSLKSVSTLQQHFKFMKSSLMLHFWILPCRLNTTNRQIFFFCLWFAKLYHFLILKFSAKLQ